MLKEVRKHPDTQGDEKVSGKHPGRYAVFPSKGCDFPRFGILRIELHFSDGATEQWVWGVSATHWFFSFENELANDLRGIILHQLFLCIIPSVRLDDLAFFGHLDRDFRSVLEASKAFGDEDKSNDPHDHEYERLEGVGPRRSARSTHENIGKNHAANNQTCQPDRNPSGPLRGRRIWKPCRERSRSDRQQCFACADDANQKIRNDQQNQDWEEQITNATGFKSGPEILNLGDITVFFAEYP